VHLQQSIAGSGAHQIHCGPIAIHKDLFFGIEQPDRVGAALKQEAEHGLSFSEERIGVTAPLDALTFVFVGVAHVRFVSWLIQVALASLGSPALRNSQPHCTFRPIVDRAAVRYFCSRDNEIEFLIRDDSALVGH
jgi:hypothetical protein